METIEGAQRTLDESNLLITGGLLSVEFETNHLKRDLRALRSSASNLRFVAAGKAPDWRNRRRLRSAGVRLALWEPFDDATLRFQLNRALGDDPDRERSDLRVPANLMARVIIAERTKDVVVYNVSATGAFLETPIALMDRSRIEVEIHLPSGPIRQQGRVLYSNVPGNLRVPSLPLGMGVEFDGGSKEDTKSLQRYVRERSASLEV